MRNTTSTSCACCSSSSAIFHNLPEFPYTPAPAAPTRLSALRSSRHFVTTLVSPSPTAPPPLLPDPPPAPENSDFFSACASPLPSSPSPSHRSAPSPPPPDRLLASIELSLSQNARPHIVEQSPSRAADFARRRPSSSSSSRLLRRLQRSKPSESASALPVVLQAPSPSSSPPRPALPLVAQERANSTTHLRRRSSWRRLRKMGRKMGSQITAPFRSLGICVAGGFGVVAFCDNRSASSSSSGSSFCSSGEYAPDFIRAVLESNALLCDRPSD